MSSYKEVNISNPGTSSKFGANDLDSVTKTLNGTIAGLPPVIVKNQNKWGYGDGILWLYNQAGNRKTTIRGQSNTPATDVDLKLPSITTNDTLSAIGIRNIWSAEQQLNAGAIFQAQSQPANPSSGFYHFFVDAADGHLKKVNNAGALVDYDTGAGGGGGGGGGSGEINTASNVGTAGVGVFKQKTIYNLEFKKLHAVNAYVTITDNTGASMVDFALAATVAKTDVAQTFTLAQTFTAAPVFNNYLTMKQVTPPATPSATYHNFYIDSSDGHLKRKSSSGSVVDYDPIPPVAPGDQQSIYDAFTSVFTYSTTDAGSGSAYTNLISPNGLWKLVYRGQNPSNPTGDRGSAGVRVPSVLPPDNSPRVYWAYPYANDNPHTDPGGTNATLTLSEGTYFTDFDVTFYMRTIDQRRTAVGTPKVWEVAWFFWHFNEAGFSISQPGAHFHHYYLLLKTNGHIEIGRKDSSTQTDFQYFLTGSAGSEPTFTWSIGTWYKIRVKQTGINIQVYVDDVVKFSANDDGTLGTTATDTTEGSPPHPPSTYMQQGRFGLYAEDAEAEWGPMTLGTASATTHTANTDVGNIWTAQQTFSTNDVDESPVVIFRPVTAGRAGIAFDMNNSLAGKVTYAFLLAEIASNTAGAHSGSMSIWTINGGVSSRKLTVDADGLLRVGANRRVQISETGLTAARTITFPDQNTFVAGQDNINLFTVAQYLGNNIPLRTQDSTVTNRDLLKWDSSNHVILGTSAGIANTWIYAGASSAALNIDNTNKLLYTKMAETGVAEVLFDFFVSDDATSHFSLSNAFNTASIFVPIFTASVTGSSITASHAASYWYNEILAANDSGAVPIVIYNAYRNTPAAITTRPLFDWRNNGTSVSKINANGDTVHTILAQSSVAEQIAKWCTSDDTVSSYQIQNAFTTASLFIPLHLNTATGTNAGTTHAAAYWYHEVKAANDSGSTPVVIYNAYLDTPAAIVTRPCYDFRNNGTSMFMLEVGNARMKDGYGFIFGTSTGTKIGTTTSQKLAFWNATPVTQRTGIADVDTSTVDTTYGTEESNVITSLRTKLNAVLQVLEDLGITAVA